MKEKKFRSLHAFIEQTARMLRAATLTEQDQARKYSKETTLSNKNKIEQIARLLRSEATKFLKRKKRKKK